MRIQRVILKYHRDITILRRDVVDDAIPDPDFSLGNLFESGDHAQRGGFSTAGGADQNHKFPVLDFEIDVFYGRHFAFVNLPDAATDDLRVVPVPLEPARLRAHCKPT